MEQFCRIVNKNDILDPLSIIIKLFIYSYKPIGSKISIGNNKIYIQDFTIIQGFIRTFNGDTKNDINILMCPITYSCNNYLKNNVNKDKYVPLFQAALNGFSNMKQMYSNTSIIFNIDHLINIISSYLDETIINEKGTDTIINTESPLYKIKENIYQHLNGAWTSHRIDILFGYVKEIIETSNNSLKMLLIDGLSNFMNCMDIITSNILLNNSI